MLGPRLTTVFASVLVAIVSVAHAQSGCAIVYGDNRAFLFATPERWVSKCRAERQTQNRAILCERKVKSAKACRGCTARFYRT